MDSGLGVVAQLQYGEPFQFMVELFEEAVEILGKFLVFQTAINHPDRTLFWGAIGVGFIGVAAGFYYYLKIVRSMYWVAPQDEHPLRLSPTSGLLIPVFAIATIIFGVYPEPILRLVGN